jgi:hypothetical protein
MLKSIIPENPPPSSSTLSSYESELEAKQLLQVGQLIINDLEKGLSAVDKDFKMFVFYSLNTICNQQKHKLILL